MNMIIIIHKRNLSLLSGRNSLEIQGPNSKDSYIERVFGAQCEHSVLAQKKKITNPNNFEGPRIIKSK